MIGTHTPMADAPLRRLGYSVRGLANWILDLADRFSHPITNMALNKLAFFSYEKVLLEDYALLTEAKIEAWEHGPVFREIYHAFKSSGDSPIETRVEFYSVDTGKAELAQVNFDNELAFKLEEFLAPLLPLRGSRLRNMSHITDGAWHRVWCHDGYANPGMEITPEIILTAARERDHSNGQY